MKVKIGNQIADAENEPIMFIFENDEDRNGIVLQLSNMAKGAHKYCIFPEGTNRDEIREFMKTE